VAPAGWAAGHALGAAVVGAAWGAALFAAAGIGAAAGGGVETHRAWPLARDASWSGLAPRGVVWLAADRPRTLPRPAGAERLRLKTRAAPVGDLEGTPSRLTLEVDGKTYKTPVGDFFDLPVSGDAVVFRNRSPGLEIGLVVDRSRALGSATSFAATAVAGGAGPALGCAALAALGSGAGALLSGAIAGLFTTLVLVLGALKGFLLEAIRHAGGIRHAYEQPLDLQETSGRFIEGVLKLVPDFGALDSSTDLSRGEWMADRVGSAARSGAVALGAVFLFALVVGGYGIRTRRTR
ncbi:MAG: hypothetical protein ACE5JG_07170, partial [Planctomycetota bacterium]